MLTKRSQLCGRGLGKRSRKADAREDEGVDEGQREEWEEEEASRTYGEDGQLSLQIFHLNPRGIFRPVHLYQLRSSMIVLREQTGK